MKTKRIPKPERPVMVDGIVYSDISIAAKVLRVYKAELTRQCNSPAYPDRYWTEAPQYPNQISIEPSVPIGSLIKLAPGQLTPELERRRQSYIMLVNMPFPQQRQWHDMATKAYRQHQMALTRRQIGRTQFFMLLRKRMHEILNERDRTYTLTNQQIFIATVKETLQIIGIDTLIRNDWYVQSTA